MQPSRRNLLIAAVVVVLGGLLAWRLVACGGSDHDDTTTTGGSSDDPGGSGLTRAGRRAGVNAAPASLSGRVTRKADGSGVPGAIVSVAPADLGKLFERESAPTTIATTDAGGAWAIPAIAPGTYVVTAAAKGLLPATQDKLVVPAGGRLTVDLALAAGGIGVAGTVTDVGGGAIRGARITLTRETMVFGGRGEIVGLTDADGHYEVTLADGSYTVRATHEDYTSAHRQFELRGERLTIDFVLSPGGEIRGQVVTRDGKPVPGALVNPRGGRDRERGGKAATADDQGKFTLEGLESGAISLTAVARGYRSTSPTVVELGIGERVDGVRVVVDRALSISGRVVKAAPPAEGIPGVQLGVFSFSGEQALASEPSDETGAFEIYGVKPGKYMFFALGEGVMPEIGKDVEVADKDVTGVVIEMSTGVSISGRVDPGAIAAIGLEIDESKIGLGNIFEVIKAAIVKAESDETGAFTLKNAPAGEFALVAKTTDGRRGKLAITIGAVDQTGLVVKLEPRASIAGRVVDGNGAAVSGVHVQVKPAGDLGSRMRFSMNDNEGEAHTGVNGAFRVVGLDPGKYKATVSDDQGQIPWARPDKKTEPIEYELAAGQAMANVTLTVETRDGVIRGLVIGPDKQPAADAWVSARLEQHDKENIELMFRSGERRPVLTNAEGRFAIDKLRRGSYELVVEGPRGASRANKTGVKPGDNVTITLETLGTLSGVVTAAGKPVAVFDLECKPTNRLEQFESGEVGRRFTNADGSYALERLAPGEYMCVVRADTGHATGKIPITTGAAKLDFALAPFATVTGVVVSALDGTPQPGMFAIASGDHAGGDEFAAVIGGKGPTTDAAGRFTIERVPPGTGKVTVVRKDAMFDQVATKDYSAAPGQRVDVGTIKIVPPRKGDAGTLGLTLANDDGKLLVASVMPGGPAELAGVAGGDRIVSIDGRPVTEIGAEVGQQLLFNGAMAIGQKFTFGLERAGKPVTATVVAVKW